MQAHMQLIRRFAASAVITEALEAQLLNGKVIDIAEHSQLASTQVPSSVDSKLRA
jgi:hypothetical protein